MKENKLKAREYVFLLLKYRSRSEKELYGRLKRKKFEEGVIREVIQELKGKGFINDEDFARAWVESRIKKPLGLRRLAQELKQKGVNRQIIDNQIQKAAQGYPEREIVSRIARQRLERLKGIDQQKARTRIYSYLSRRGFSPEVIIDCINGL